MTKRERSVLQNDTFFNIQNIQQHILHRNQSKGNVNWSGHITKKSLPIALTK